MHYPPHAFHFDHRSLMRLALALLLGAHAVACNGGGADPAPPSDAGTDDRDAMADPDGSEPDGGPEPSCECDNGTCATIVDETGAERTLCQCDTGFAGDACDVCAPGYAGDRCDDCADGFAESEDVPGLCEPAPCQGVDCSGHGTCHTEVTETGIEVAQCECEERFQGDVCELCEPGYEGDDCSTCSDGYVLSDGECIEDSCVGISCGDHGACTGGACECDEGYAGSSCDSCDTGYVASSGECVADGCEEVECDHGSCVVTLAGPVCDCSHGWALPSCDACLPGYFEREVEGVTECVNELPVQDGRLEKQFDAAALWTFVVDDMGRVERWYERHSSAYLIPADTSMRPRQIAFPAGVEFDGVDDDLWTIGDWLIPEGDSFAVFMVVQWDPDGGIQTLLDSVYVSMGDSEAYALDALDADTVRFRMHDGTSPTPDVVVSDDFDAAAGRQLVVVERRPFFDGAALSLSNGTDTTTLEADNGGFPAASLGVVGRCTVGGPILDCHLEGQVHEIIVYDGELTGSERDDVIAYLRAKWSL